MEIEENLVAVSSLPYSTELIDKIYSLPGKINTLQNLLNGNPSSQGKGIRTLEQEIIDKLRREIIDDLFCICYNLNRPEFLGNNMIKFFNTSRYGWSGRGLGRLDRKELVEAGVLKFKI